MKYFVSIELRLIKFGASFYHQLLISMESNTNKFCKTIHASRCAVAIICRNKQWLNLNWFQSLNNFVTLSCCINGQCVFCDWLFEVENSHETLQNTLKVCKVKVIMERRCDTIYSTGYTCFRCMKYFIEFSPPNPNVLCPRCRKLMFVQCIIVSEW